MGERSRLLESVSQKLGARQLVWAGLRADDVESIADLPQFSGSVSIIGGRRPRSSIEEVRYEDLTGVRVDLDAWDIDDHLDAHETKAFRQSILRMLAGPSVMLPYRPSAFLSSIHFARRSRSLDLGLFGGLQSAFEHKPWVESSVAALGIPHIGWDYIADEEQDRARERVSNGPVMLRRSRTSGGAGLVYVDNPADLEAMWPRTTESLVSIAPYIDGGLPVNVGATVWHDGVTVRHPSVQLVGIRECVNRAFGYCGNDFGRVNELGAPMLRAIEESTVIVGHWLRSKGYLGTFGVDFLVKDGVPLFTEINPRFQGSTHASARLSVESEDSCLFLDHIAAMFLLDAPPQIPLAVQLSNSIPLSHLVVHWTGNMPANLDADQLVHEAQEQGGYDHSDVVVLKDIRTEPGGVVARITFRDSITTTGFDLVDPWPQLIDRWRLEQGARTRATAADSEDGED